MKLGPIIHGGLLLGALLVGYQTSTRSTDTSEKYGTEAIWDVSKISELHLDSPKKTVVLEWRTDEQGEYLWGQIQRVSSSDKQAADKQAADKQAADKQAADKQAADKQAAVKQGTDTVRREFPVGDAGERLMAQYENLHVLRNLGVLDEDKQRQYDLLDDTSDLTIFFGGTNKRSLRVANRSVYGGRDRYILDLETQMGYVISKDLLQPIRNAENSLALKAVHTYNEDLVTSVEIRTTTGDQIALKRPEEAKKGKKLQVWSRQESPNRPDPALSSFLERTQELKPSRYEVSLSVSELEHIATLRYRNQEKQVLGYLQLYRKLPTDSDDASKADPIHSSKKTQYYIQTERTRVLAKVGRLIAERIDEDLVEIFNIAPPPKPQPTPKPIPKPTNNPNPTETNKTPDEPAR